MTTIHSPKLKAIFDNEDFDGKRYIMAKLESNYSEEDVIAEYEWVGI